jgi:flagellar biosynthetic protein FlhB
MAGEKTEQPTQRRLEDARKKGQVARSREIDSALVLLATYGVFRFGGAYMWNSSQALIIDTLADLDRDPVNTDLVAALGMDLMFRGLLILVPLLGAILALSLLGGIAQTGGPLFSVQALKPQASRMNPLQGAKRLFASKQALANLAKSLGKFVVLGGVSCLVLWLRRDELLAIGLTMGLLPSLGVLVDLGFQLTLVMTLVVVLMAAADYLFQRYDFSSQMRMSRQDVKDELRQTDGDPQVKAQLARLRRSLLNRVMQAVPEADVVLVNPTHYAVALRYDPASSNAPVLLAKGARLIAQRIREVAEENGIPVIRNAPLTRALYSAAEVGREIPPELYEAVAEILAFVYRLRAGQTTWAEAPVDLTGADDPVDLTGMEDAVAA